MRLHQISSCGSLHGIGHLGIIITDDYNYVPNPVVGNPYNTFVEFRSRKPGMANVDWGDGIKEQFPMTKVQGQDNYCIIFRSLAIQQQEKSQ